MFLGKSFAKLWKRRLEKPLMYSFKTLNKHAFYKWSEAISMDLPKLVNRTFSQKQEEGATLKIWTFSPINTGKFVISGINLHIFYTCWSKSWGWPIPRPLATALNLVPIVAHFLLRRFCDVTEFVSNSVLET